MKKKWRIMVSWTLVSLMLQLPTYYFLNRQIENVMSAPTTPTIVRTLKANLPGTNFEDVQVSYAKDYLAYKENGVLKVYNLKQEKQVFEKKPASDSDKNMGILYFQWLPDRNTLVYFSARKNPNPVTTIIVPGKQTPDPKTTQPTTPTVSSNTSNSSKNSFPSNAPQSSKTSITKSIGNSSTVHAQAVTSTQTTKPDTTQTQTVKPETTKTEDPQQTPSKTPEQSSNTVTEQHTEKRYNNPQITDLYTLELPDSDESTSPDDRFNESINSFPAGGQITNLVVSTFTNLMYLTIKSGTNLQLMEIDVMKNIRTLNRSGELVTNMAASDKFGTLYIESKTGSSKIIQSLEGWERQTISMDATETILGDRSGTLYLGQIEGDQLIKIRSASDNSDPTKLEFKTIWQGSIPYKNAHVVIGTEHQIVINTNQTAYIIQSNGQQKQVELTGKENFVSQDGVELVQLTPARSTTDVQLKPLQ